MWQVSWAHPKWGTVLASCSYDRKVIVWKEVNPSTWQQVFTHSEHMGSVSAAANPSAPVPVPFAAVPPAVAVNARPLAHPALQVNSIAFCPHEFGLELACASSDGTVSLLAHRRKPLCRRRRAL